MTRFLLHHVHRPQDCGVAFASFKGHDSPLRHQTTIASCHFGGHEIWWEVQASSPEEALQLLPFYVAQRTVVVEVAAVDIP
jgi:hypothetical protein